VGPQGDIAIDDILIYRLGDAQPVAVRVPHGLPITCNFEEEGLCSLESPYYKSQLDWSKHRGETASKNTGPSVDHTLGNDQGHYIYTEASFTNVSSTRAMDRCGQMFIYRVGVVTYVRECWMVCEQSRSSWQRCTCARVRA